MEGEQMAIAAIFKAYDIRGRYPDEINEEIAHSIGAGLVQFLDTDRIVVGQDARISSPALADAFIEGATAAGASATDVGVCTSPLLYFATIDGKFGGGAMVTASHLPAEMNGFKLCRELAIPLSGDRGLPALQSLVARGIATAGTHLHRGPHVRESVLEKYIDRISVFVHDPAPSRIVVDGSNGSVGPEVSELLPRFPVWTPTLMYMKPDGTFPHHLPNPLIPSATRELQETVVKIHADIGVEFDGDADRCGFIDENGERVREDLVTALLAESYLARNPGETVLYDLRSSRAVPEAIARMGGRATRSRVGHAFVKANMREVNAILAGELSGHYYFRDTGFTDNALFAMVQILNLLALRRRPLSELVEPLKRYSSTGEINIFLTNQDTVMAALESKYAGARMDHLDGLTVEYPEWWFNLRPSNTEPVVRLNLEASGPDMMEEKENDLLEAIKAADPDMELQT